MPNTPNFFHRKFNHLNNPLHSTRGSVSFNMSLHTKSQMTPSSHSNMPSPYKIKEIYLAPTQICLPHIRSRKATLLPLTSLQMQVSITILDNSKILWSLSKWRFHLRYACFSPWMDNWSLHTCLTSSGLQTIIVLITTLS